MRIMPGLSLDLDVHGLAAVVVRYDARHPDQKLQILERALPGLAILDEALAGVVGGSEAGCTA